MEFEFDRHALEAVVAQSQAFKKIKAEHNANANAIVQAVRGTHSGRSEIEVDAEMRRLFAEAGINPVQPGFTQTVQEIAGRASEG